MSTNRKFLKVSEEIEKAVDRTVKQMNYFTHAVEKLSVSVGWEYSPDNGQFKYYKPTPVTITTNYQAISTSGSVANIDEWFRNAYLSNPYRTKRIAEQELGDVKIVSELA